MIALGVIAQQALVRMNSAPMGSVVISGSPIDGQTLTASNTLSDADGMGAVSYQWNADGVAIIGATGSSYTLTAADVGNVITVTASYTDGFGTAESVTSAGVGPIAAATDPHWASVAALLRFDAKPLVNLGYAGAWGFVLHSAGSIVNDALAFGGKSLRVEGMSTTVRSSAKAAYSLTTLSEWTLEGWVRLDDANTPQGIWFAGDITSNNNRIQLGTSGNTGTLTLYLQGATGTGVSINSGPAVLTSGQRHWIEVNRDGDLYRLFIDGVLVASGTYTYAMSAVGQLSIGVARSGGVELPALGHFDDWRYTVGVCRNTASYAPPTGPLLAA